MKRALSVLMIELNTITAFPTEIRWEQKDGAITTTSFESPKFNTPIGEELFNYSEEVYTEKDK